MQAIPRQKAAISHHFWMQLTQSPTTKNFHNRLTADFKARRYRYRFVFKDIKQYTENKIASVLELSLHYAPEKEPDTNNKIALWNITLLAKNTAYQR